MKSHAKAHVTTRKHYKYKVAQAFGMLFLQLTDMMNPERSVSLRILHKHVRRKDLIYTLHRLLTMP
jgi:hypothetical protein